jgi:hypothetical protein
MYAQASAKQLAQAPDLRQLPVAAAQARECALAEDVHLHIGMMSLADGGVDAFLQITAMQAPHACSEKRYTWESVNCNLP